MKNVLVKEFDDWRCEARKLLLLEIKPCDISWVDSDMPSLFDNDPDSQNIIPGKKLIVPNDFINLAKAACCFRDHKKWGLLYKVLWRLTHGEKHLLKISTDDDVLQLRNMEKAVRRDNHKMKAFVRFRKLENEDLYIAWHEPSHLIVKRAAPFFTRRFAAMNFIILTPDISCYWNKQELVFGDGLPRKYALKKDDVENLWKVFYRNIFNPARIKIKMMKSEMPMKYWHTMPETALIPGMLAEAESRVKKMIEDNKPRFENKKLS